MTDVLSIALSGLNAQQKRLTASASNIAHASTAGRVPDGATSAKNATGVYTPMTVTLSSPSDGGGVQSTFSDKKDAVSLSYAPTSPLANNEGMVATPQVDLAEEAVTAMESKTLFKANLSVLKTQDDMMGDLLDTLA
jgi:flagellar basal-body rod protein FlgC